jgi:rubrerythrin
MKPPNWKTRLIISWQHSVEKQTFYTIDTYINDAQKANRQDLVKMWNTIKQDRERHLQMLREALEKEAKQEKLK